MLGHHFNSIISMVTNAAKRQTKSPMAAADHADSPKDSTYDESSPNKTSFQTSAVRSAFPHIKMLVVYFAIYISVGTTCFLALKNHIRGHKTNDFIDSLYLCVVTMTTVGYGDLVPHSALSQLVCTVFITVGMCLVGIVVKIAANYLVVKQQMVMVNALHLSQKLGPIQALKEMESLKIDYTKCIISLIAMVAHLVIGIFVLVGIEGMDFDEAVYCACTTMTTVGFGDESFSSEFGRIFGILWISTGTSCLGQLFLYIAEVYTDLETRKLVKWVLTSNTFAKKDIEAANYKVEDDDKVFGTADFTVHKLKETGKIKQKDIWVGKKEMDIDGMTKDLDVDKTVSDSSQRK